MQAPLPPDEAGRLRTLAAYDVLDTPAEQAFDDLALLASRICGTPIALMTLVDERRQWFKSRVNFGARETSRDVSFCAHAILGDDLFVVPDAQADARFAANPLVRSDPRIRFYAGAPLVAPDGHAVGTLCVIDRTPRSLTPEQAEALRRWAGRRCRNWSCAAGWRNSARPRRRCARPRRRRRPPTAPRASSWPT